MVIAGTTLRSARIGPQKEKKNGWREMLQYLHDRVDRTRFQRRVGSVIVIDKEALKQEMEKRAGQRQKQGVSVGYCSCGAAYPPCVDAVFSKGCNVTSSVVGCKMSWRMRSDSKQRETMHTTDTPQVTQITEGGTHRQVEHTHSTRL